MEQNVSNLANRKGGLIPRSLSIAFIKLCVGGGEAGGVRQALISHFHHYNRTPVGPSSGIIHIDELRKWSSRRISSKGGCPMQS